MENGSPDLKAIAPYMPQGDADPGAKVFYDILADALVWSDEKPHPAEDDRPLSPSCLRAVWHYRTSLILGRPDERCRVHWEEAQRLFPDWPGFAAIRRHPDLAAIYHKKSEPASRSLLDLDDPCA